MLNESSKVRVNLKACAAVAEVLRSYAVPTDREESELPHLPRELIPNFYFYVVGICHQTSPRGLPPAEGTVEGKRRVGWDFLWSKFEEACRSDLNRLTPKSWAKETPASFSRTFSDDRLGFRLSDLEGRVRLVRSMGNQLIGTRTTNVHALYKRCEGRIRRGSPNLLTELSSFQAYSDPVEKKSIFFLSLMRNTGVWEFVDPEALEAPVDYHEVRGHLRIGTIEVSDPNLSEAIRLQKLVPVQDDIAIRAVTREAIRTISDDAGITPSQAHYLFWNVFRALCLREDPQCVSETSAATLAARYRSIAGKGCPFAPLCRAFATRDFPIEHQTETQFY